MQREIPILKTDRLTLRALTAADAPLISLYVGDKRVAKHLDVVPHPYPDGAADSFIAFANNPETTETVWAIAKDDQLIGAISLAPKEDGVGNIGYWLAPQLRGGGLMPEALAGVIDHARAAGFCQLTASVHQDNEASSKVLMKNGFDYIGDSEAFSISNNAMVPRWDYRLALTDS